MKFPVRSLLFIIIPLLLLLACRKDSFTNNAAALLTTSADSLHFDTVFTTAGSVTQTIKIINNNNKGIHISSIRLTGGNSSSFRINADGQPGPQVNNIDISANDSTYIFITVSINPNSANLAFLIRDSIEINYNGNKKLIQLDAFGQNAHFFRNKVVAGNETWNNDLPYVLLGSLIVDTNAILSINKGCHIYIHADAPFIVNGSLQVNGEKYDSTRVVFTGDRLDFPYRDFPASYPGLIFTDVSKNNSISYGIIKNAYQAIVATEPAALGTKLNLYETIIDNAYDAGILGLNTSITARNVLVSNCGKNIVLANGGSYNFTHCTAASYSSNYLQHKDPILQVTNYFYQNIASTNNLDAVFRNCIFWAESNGIVENEVVTGKNGTALFNVLFDHILWRVKNNPAYVTIIAPLTDNPQFDSINIGERYFNFRLKDSSPALNSGIDAGVTLDLDGNQRPVGIPDIGCYEKQ